MSEPTLMEAYDNLKRDYDSLLKERTGELMDNWITVNSASSEPRDAIDSIAEVLKDMGIDLVYDDEQATKDNVDLFIRLNHIREEN